MSSFCAFHQVLTSCHFGLSKHSMQFSVYNDALPSYNLDQCYVRHEGIWVRGGIAPLILYSTLCTG